MFKVTKYLSYSKFSNYGDNLLKLPFRIISPYNNTQNEENNNTNIQYKQLNGNIGKISCSTNILVPDPYCYFRGDHTFLQSLLILLDNEFMDNAHLPKKSNHIMEAYIKNMCSHFTDNKKYNKCIQQILFNSSLYTGPDKNIHFRQFIQMFFEYNRCECIIICSDKDGYFSHTIPENISNISKTCYVILQFYTGKFAPYGIYNNKK